MDLLGCSGTAHTTSVKEIRMKKGVQMTSRKSDSLHPVHLQNPGVEECVKADGNQQITVKIDKKKSMQHTWIVYVAVQNGQKIR